MDFTEKNDSVKYELRPKGTSFLFTITETTEASTSGEFYSKITYSPRVPIKDADERVGVTIAENKPYFEKWLSIIKEELYGPDLWAEAQATTKLFTLNSAVPNEMFNAAELRQLEGQVRQLEKGLAALSLPAHAQKALTDTIKEIPEKATRFTKKELEGWFMGAFIGQVTQLALSQEHVSAIAHLLKTTFMGLLQLH